MDPADTRRVQPVAPGSQNRYDQRVANLCLNCIRLTEKAGEPAPLSPFYKTGKTSCWQSCTAAPPPSTLDAVFGPSSATQMMRRHFGGVEGPPTEKERQVAGQAASVAASPSISLHEYPQCSGDCTPKLIPESPGGGTPASDYSQAIPFPGCSVWTGGVQSGCPGCLSGPRCTQG